MTELSFKGKEFVYNHHLAVPFRPLVPDETKGIGPVALDGNLVIHGDNLHALKSLLPLYAGKVDCIFIDPPYNTGNEGWCYDDNVNAPMIREWLESNPIGIEDGLRHDKWCAMMWPRLRLLHELLADDGSIWITIDDNEGHRLKLMLDEVFGKENFLANFVWQSKDTPGNNSSGIAETHNHVIAFRKSEDFTPDLLERNEDQIANYTNPDGDHRGDWLAAPLTRAEHRDRDYYALTNRAGREVFPPKGSSWRRPPAKMKWLESDKRIWWGKNGDADFPMEKKFLKEAKPGVVNQTWWPYTFAGSTRNAGAELKELFEGEKPFETPKPRQLIERILELSCGPDAIVLDSFAGSGTTAHAVLATNEKDGGNRHFILVEMENYADRLTAERVRRVMNGYDFKGTQKTELLRERLNWRALNNSGDLVHKVEAIENLHGHEYDRIKKEVKDGELIVTGEKTVAERAEGLGGCFTYCTLGDPVELDKVLNGETLPPYSGLGSALFHMATNHALDTVVVREDDFYLGASEGQHVWLIYKPDLDWLKSPEAALTLARAKAFAASDPDRRHLVFAPARFVSQKMLAEQNIPVEFVPLPFALYRIDRS
ncbi:site-specific DNA-methyltransferase [Sphingopyxis indica]|uniref:site-specific DNA-methyltransferase n=1 Tax=Sphingopyxis indica TaxID=436663 RepID=UPI0029392277|nr:site-specific DNA-methyltransferase [Sphingopyxis indica]WOF43543.1 site-specific DNA-methyltransferase [Sphingopyxis indica]